MTGAGSMSATTTGGSQAKTGSRAWKWTALLLWILPMLVVSVMVATRPYKRTVTPLYHEAVQHWWAREPLYGGPSGMNYLPQFTILFGPFHVFPVQVGDVLWRLTAAAGLAWGIWSFTGTFKDRDRNKTFALATILALPLCLAALRNGQANAHFAACLLLAAWFLHKERWGWASVLLAIAVAIKPLGLAAMGLAWVMYPRLWWRLALGVVVLIGAPFAFGPPDYVISQFRACAENLRQCSVVTEHRFADLNGIFRTFESPLSERASLLIRAIAGVLFAGVCWLVKRRAAFPSALVWLSAAAGYLMLFNPMNEENSYVIFAPAMCLFALWYASRREVALGWLIAIMMLTMGILPNVVRPWFGNYFALFWHPTMTIAFLAILGAQIFGLSKLKPSEHAG